MGIVDFFPAVEFAIRVIDSLDFVDGTVAAFANLLKYFILFHFELFII
jgi:hypothetical protein